MGNLSIAQNLEQRDRAHLERMIRRVEERVTRLYEERDRLADLTDRQTGQNVEWVQADNALFEARCEQRRLNAALRMAGRRWRCERCGETYGPDWVAAWGLRCDIECDGSLTMVRQPSHLARALAAWREANPDGLTGRLVALHRRDPELGMTLAYYIEKYHHITNDERWPYLRADVASWPRHDSSPCSICGGRGLIDDIPCWRCT